MGQFDAIGGIGLTVQGDKSNGHNVIYLFVDLRPLGLYTQKSCTIYMF